MLLKVKFQEKTNIKTVENINKGKLPGIISNFFNVNS